jgi:hypothetical protein
MVETIQPRQYFPISRNLADPNDTATYYLQAVIKNATTGATIQTVNLTNLSGRLHAASWQAPADSTGRGLFITITTTVYTDSGRTTKSDVYQEEHETYLVYDRFNMLQALAMQINALSEGGQGADIDYKKIREIFKAVAEKIKPEVHIETKNVDFGQVLTRIDQIPGKVVSAIEFPETEDIDFSPVIKEVQKNSKEIVKKIDDLDIPEDVDLSPVLEAIDSLSVDGFTEKVKKINELMTTLHENFEKFSPDIQKSMEKILSELKDFLYAVAVKEGSQQKEKPAGPRTELNRFGNIVKRQ